MTTKRRWRRSSACGEPRAVHPDGDRLDILATLINVYESEHDPMDPPDPVEAIEFRMEQQGLSRKESNR